MCELHRHARSETLSPRRHSLVLGTLSLTFPSYLLVFPSRLSFVYIFLFPACTIHPSLLLKFSSLILPLILARFLSSPSLSLSLSLSPLSLLLPSSFFFSFSFLFFYVIFLLIDDPLSRFLLFFRFFNVFPDISVLFFMKLLFRLYQ